MAKKKKPEELMIRFVKDQLDRSISIENRDNGPGLVVTVRDRDPESVCGDTVHDGILLPRESGDLSPTIAAQKKGKGVYIELFHGRRSLTKKMDDWGDGGPILGPFYWVHTTYATHIKLGMNRDSVGDLYVKNDLVYYDGVWYGDWSVFTKHQIKIHDLSRRIEEFSQAKAELPQDKKIKLKGKKEK